MNPEILKGQQESKSDVIKMTTFNEYDDNNIMSTPSYPKNYSTRLRTTSTLEQDEDDYYETPIKNRSNPKSKNSLTPEQIKDLEYYHLTNHKKYLKDYEDKLLLLQSTPDYNLTSSSRTLTSSYYTSPHSNININNNNNNNTPSNSSNLSLEFTDEDYSPSHHISRPRYTATPRNTTTTTTISSQYDHYNITKPSLVNEVPDYSSSEKFRKNIRDWWSHPDTNNENINDTNNNNNITNDNDNILTTDKHNIYDSNVDYMPQRSYGAIRGSKLYEYDSNYVKNRFKNDIHNFFNPDTNTNTNNSNKEGSDVLMIRGFSDLPETPRARK